MHDMERFSVAFDVYLGILQGVKELVNSTLGQNENDWLVKNSCTACNYKVHFFPHLSSLLNALLSVTS